MSDTDTEATAKPEGELLTVTAAETPCPEEPKPVVSKDRWTILTLLTFKHTPLDVKRIKLEDGPYVLVFTFPPDSKDLYERYMRGEKLPVEDIREVERAERVFKGYLHRFSASM